MGDACSMCLVLAIAGTILEPQNHIMKYSEVLIQGCRGRFMAKCLALVDDSEEVEM